MRELEERYLKRLSELYPTIAKASTEIINLSLPISMENTRPFLMF